MKRSPRIGAGTFRGRAVPVPPKSGGHLSLTPSLVKEAAFQLFDQVFDPPETVFFDLCAGSGQMSWEALSRGFQEVHLGEVDRGRLDFLIGVIKDSGYRVIVHKRDFRRMAPIIRSHERVAVYIDPPYTFFHKKQCEPVDRFLHNLITPGVPDFSGSSDQKTEGAEQTKRENRLQEARILIQGPDAYEPEQGLQNRMTELGITIESRDYRGNRLTVVDFKT